MDFFFLLVSFKGRGTEYARGRERVRECKKKERESSIQQFTPQILENAEAEPGYSQEPETPFGQKEPKYLSPPLLLSRCINMKLNQKWSSRSSTWHSFMGCWYHTVWINALCHSAHSSFHPLNIQPNFNHSSSLYFIHTCFKQISLSDNNGKCLVITTQ